ncbi:MAG: 3-deoxy-D-manno-octulosonic acid transferase [Candidatus Rariloculaceae bacterium]
MGLLLNLAYFVAAIVVSPWLLYRLVIRGDRNGLLSRFSVGLGPGLDSSIWLHGASAGEISLLEPIVGSLERDMPATPLIVSAYSSTGFAAAQRLFPRHRVILFPFDLTFVVSRVLDRFDPRLVVIVESDFWPNYLAAAQRRNIPVAVVNGKISVRSYERNARIGFMSMLLKRVALFAVQTQEYAARLRKIGVADERLQVTGNMKYDLAQPAVDAEAARQLRSQLGFVEDDIVIIGGSLHQGEDELFLDAFLALGDDGQRASLVVVPRYPQDARRVERAVRSRGQLAVLKSDIDSGVRQAPGAAGILIVDTVGELRSLYSAADIAFVGGSLKNRGSHKGGHNLMEPAIAGIPILFGPYHYSFRETALELVRANAGMEVQDEAELLAALTSLKMNPELRREMGSRARGVVIDGQGATRRNYELLAPLLAFSGDRLPAPGLDSTMPEAVSDTDSP